MKNHRIIANPDQASLNFGLPHEYHIRRSKRAKHLRINIHPQTGVEVVLPERMSERHVKPFVQQHSAWISHQVHKLGMDKPHRLPESVHLKLTDEHWNIDYKTVNRETFSHKQKAGQLTIVGPNTQLHPCRRQLYLWLRKRARQLLPARLEILSQSTGLRYNRVSIRTQKTRWGSCSSRGNINLNDRLVLLPAGMADYVMIHELCHTVEMNHSRAFWRLVDRHCADYKIQQKNLRQARQLLPDWI